MKDYKKDVLHHKIIILLIFLCSSPAIAFSNSKEKIDFLINRIKQSTTIDVHYLKTDVPPPLRPWTYDVIPESDYDKLWNYVMILQCELNKVPKQTAINSGLKNIYLVKNIRIEGFKAGGYVNMNRMYCDCFTDTEDFRRSIIHHEFFHILDRVYHGPYSLNYDPIWSAYNEKDFKYKSNSKTGNANDKSGLMNHPQKGFINLYSMSALREDKAEIYGALRVPDKAKKLYEWAKSDEVLAKKIKYIGKFSIMASKPCESVPWLQWDREAIDSSMPAKASNENNSKLNESPSLSGHVRDQYGKIVSMASIIILPQAGDGCNTDNSGFYKICFTKERDEYFRGIVSYVVAYHKRRALAAITKLDSLSGGQVDLSLQPGVTIRGNVVMPQDKSIEDMKVRILVINDRDDPNNWESFIFEPGQDFPVDQTGKFEISGLPVLPKPLGYRLSLVGRKYGAKPTVIKSDELSPGNVLKKDLVVGK